MTLQPLHVKYSGEVDPAVLGLVNQNKNIWPNSVAVLWWFHWNEKVEGNLGVKYVLSGHSRWMGINFYPSILLLDTTCPINTTCYSSPIHLSGDEWVKVYPHSSPSDMSCTVSRDGDYGSQIQQNLDFLSTVNWDYGISPYLKLGLGRLKLISCFTSARASDSAKILKKLHKVVFCYFLSCLLV